MAHLPALLSCLALLATLVSGQSWTGDYKTLGKSCDPGKDSCFPGSTCNPTTKICDCADSSDGDWKRTFQNSDCRLLPESRCVLNVDQDFYRCVENAKCTMTRMGKDPSTCPADSACDTGDFHCKCQPGQTCETQKVAATPQ